jgi:hypothetical protein
MLNFVYQVKSKNHETIRNFFTSCSDIIGSIYGASKQIPAIARPKEFSG